MLPHLVLTISRESFWYTEYKKSILCTVFLKKQMTHFRKITIVFLKIYIFFNKNKIIHEVYIKLCTNIISIHPNNLLKFHIHIFNSFWILKVQIYKFDQKIENFTKNGDITYFLKKTVNNTIFLSSIDPPLIFRDG